MLPGIDTRGALTCRDCAGITTPLQCVACGKEAERVRGGKCARCLLVDDLNALMHAPAPGTSAATLITALTCVQRPASITTWMRNPDVQFILAALGTGHMQFSHQGFDALPDKTATQHIRALCVDNELLPARDEYFATFTHWIASQLEKVENLNDRNVLQQLITWHHLKRMTQLHHEGKPTQAGIHNAKQEITSARSFLAYFREGNTSLRACTQLDIDHWLATGTTTRHRVRTFIIWAKAARHCSPSLIIGFRHAKTTPLISDATRISLLEKSLLGEELLRTRVAAMLVLLYAQPISRIARLTQEAISHHDPTLAITFSTEPVIIPEPFATLVLNYLTTINATSGTRTRQSPWLFPGRTSNSSIHPTSLRNELARFGIDLQGGKNGALRQLVRNAPAPVVADLMGYSQNVIHRHAATAGTNNTRYAAIKANQNQPKGPHY